MDQQLAEALDAAKAAHFDARGAACDYAALAVSRQRVRLVACLAELEGFDIRRAHMSGHASGSARTAIRWTTSSTACYAAMCRGRHFALHSACRSSPPLRVFDGGKLDRQLEEAATDSVRRTVRVESRGAVIVLPRLFRWFGQDFGGQSGIIEFVAARIDDESAVEMIDRRHGNVKLRYLDFDWRLNRVR